MASTGRGWVVRRSGSEASAFAVRRGETSSNRPEKRPPVTERVASGSGVAGLKSARRVQPADASRTALSTPAEMTAEICASRTITRTTMQYIARVAPVRKGRAVGYAIARRAASPDSDGRLMTGRRGRSTTR